MNNKNSVKPVVAVAIGAALFFVLGRFVAIPSGIPNCFPPTYCKRTAFASRCMSPRCAMRVWK